jgi:hypothetical protein
MRGSAQTGRDYTLSGNPGSITIPAGQSFATISLHAIADHVKERNETAIMALVSGSGYKLSGQANATLTIVNGP